MLIHAADIRKLLFFLFCQIIISFCVEAVCAFSRNTTEDIDCHICICLCDCSSCRHSEFGCTVNIKESRYLILQFGSFFFDLIAPCISCCLVLSVIIFDPVFCCNLKSGIFQTLENCNSLTLIHITGSGSSFDCSGSTNSIESNFCSFLQRKKLSFIFQKYHSLCCSFSGNFAVLQFSFRYCIICCACEMSCLDCSHSTVSSSS